MAFNLYKFRRDGLGQEYAVIVIDSKRFGRLEVYLDRADLDEYLAAGGRRLYAARDGRGIRAVFRVREGGTIRETPLYLWVMRRELEGTDLRVHVRDGNLLNARRANLELRSRSEIGHRTGRRSKESHLPPGVTYDAGRAKPYTARIWIDGKGIYLGAYVTPSEAHQAYRKAKLQALAPYECERQ